MSRNTIFDIDYIVCPLCKKTHKVHRKEFDAYCFKCTLYEKQFFIKINSLNVEYSSLWVKWL